MLSDLEIYRTAQATIQAYGAGAVLHAAQRAYELMAAGLPSWHHTAYLNGESTDVV